MIRFPFHDDEVHQSSNSVETTKQPQKQLEENTSIEQHTTLQGMKIFGARYNKDHDCMNQANFIALAMERKRKRHTEHFIHRTATTISGLFNFNMTSSSHDHQQTEKLNPVLDLLELRYQDDDTCSVTSSNYSDYSKRSSEIEFTNRKEYDDSNNESWRSLQDFSDVLKSEAMIRQKQQR